MFNNKNNPLYYYHIITDMSNILPELNIYYRMLMSPFTMNHKTGCVPNILESLLRKDMDTQPVLFFSNKSDYKINSKDGKQQPPQPH